MRSDATQASMHHTSTEIWLTDSNEVCHQPTLIQAQFVPFLHPSFSLGYGTERQTMEAFSSLGAAVNPVQTRCCLRV